MAVFLNTDFAFHDGEISMARRFNVPEADNPTVPTLSPQLANSLQIAPLISIGTVDKEGRPWTTLWGGQKGMSQSLGGGIIGIKTPVTGKYDPVVEELVGKEATGEVIHEQGKGRMVSGLTIDLETRKRVKLYGRMVAGMLSMRDDEVTGHEEHIAAIQLVLKIEQSLGNCPKYLNKKAIQPALSKPELVSDSPKLSQAAIDLIEKSDLFFVSSAQNDRDMDTNHRGGPPGFLRVASNDDSGAVLCWPEYSGNRLYQTLGNLVINPKAGLCIPDFETGAMLYLTGTTEILIGKDAAAYLPRSNLCVKVTTTSARYVASALPFRGVPGERSPYNPVVRYLSSERPPPRSDTDKSAQSLQSATLISQTPLTPTISRFRFSLSQPATYTPGQYVTLDFSPHLDMGYSHMRDSDPRSINDDFVRTFTVSSPPNPATTSSNDEFEITIRKVGTVTDFMWKYGLQGADAKRGNWLTLEVDVKGFGGEFEVVQQQPPQDGNVADAARTAETICYIAAGVGITPLLPSLGRLDYDRMRVLWSVRAEDVGLVRDVVGRHPDLAGCLRVFVTNGGSQGESVDGLTSVGVAVEMRRMGEEDLRLEGLDVERYYLCTAVPMRKQLMEWLPGKELVFEDFNF